MREGSSRQRDDMRQNGYKGGPEVQPWHALAGCLRAANDPLGLCSLLEELKSEHLFHIERITVRARQPL